MRALGLLALLALGQEAQVPSPGKNSPEEAAAPMASAARAAAFLDSAALHWTRRKQCVTCHTNLPYLWARPALKSHEGPAMGEVRAFLERIADTWEAGKPTRKLVVPYAWDSQIVGTAVALAVHDARTTGKLHPLTRRALEKTWALQKPEGSWSWPDCDWPPLERDEWASIKLEELMDVPGREATLRNLLSLQREDGGWCLPAFGEWKRHDGSPNRKDSPSDGYATGLAVLVLRQAGFAADHPAVKRGADWLLSNQRESGRWFTRSLGTDDYHYLTHVGTAYAVMALEACGRLPE
jgi:squalene-hopene/tetraprenyl-beta-curcumene cyclase